MRTPRKRDAPTASPPKRSSDWEAHPQIKALGIEGTTLVNVITALASNGLKFVPEILVGGSDSSSLSGLINTLMAKVASDMKSQPPK